MTGGIIPLQQSHFSHFGCLRQRYRGERGKNILGGEKKPKGMGHFAQNFESFVCQFLEWQ